MKHNNGCNVFKGGYCSCGAYAKSKRDELSALKEHNARLQNDIDGAKVSLGKFFDYVHPNDITNQACDVREMYCKLGDENARLRRALEGIDDIRDTRAWLTMADIAKQALGAGK